MVEVSTAGGLLDHPHAGGVADELLELLVEGLGGDEAAGYGHLLLLGQGVLAHVLLGGLDAVLGQKLAEVHGEGLRYDHGERGAVGAQTGRELDDAEVGLAVDALLVEGMAQGGLEADALVVAHLGGGDGVGVVVEGVVGGGSGG